jgi:hypothetical protein
MKKHIALAVAALLAAVSSTSLVHAASSVQVKVENKCGSITHSLDAGDRIVVGKSVIHTVSAASAKQPVIVCNK